MKNIFYSILFIATSLLFNNCTDENKPIFIADLSSEEIAFKNSFADEYLLSKETKENIADRFIWNETTLGTNNDYELQGAIDSSFETHTIIGKTNATNYTVLVKQLLDFAEQLELDNDPTTTGSDGSANNKGIVYFRVKAIIGNSGDGTEEIFSETQSINIVWIEQELITDENPPILFIVGDNTAWSFEPLTWVISRKFTKTVTLTNGNIFNFYETDKWEGAYRYNYFKSVDNNLIDAGDKDNNFRFDGTTGTYTITVDLEAKTVDLEAVELPSLSQLELVWSDEFSADGSLDSNKWRYESGFVRNNELQWYQSANTRVENGHLVIEARRENNLRNPNYRLGSTAWQTNREFVEYTSASLISRQTWQYGIFEVRAKIRAEDGLWPAIWFLGERGEWPACGEIDLMEYYQGNIHANAAWGSEQRWKAKWDSSTTPVANLGNSDWDNEFHTWIMDWNSERIHLYLDGQLLNIIDVTQTINPPNMTPQNPFHQPHKMLLNLAIGGTNGGDPSTTPFPSIYQIDYVRVYDSSTLSIK